MKFKTIQRTLPGLGALIIATLAFAGCEAADPHASEFSSVATSVVPGSYEAEGILWVANTLDQATLDDDVRLDRRAATNIVNTRAAAGAFQTIEALDAVSYVGQSALDRMLDYAIAQGQVGDCGDGVINGAEACDGGDACTPECTVGEPGGGDPVDDSPTPPVSVHGVVEGSYLGLAVLSAANDLGLEALDDDVALDARAARAIVANQPIASLTALDALPYVGAAAFGRLTDWVVAHDRVPFCGDGIVQPSVEACDDGNQVSGDACPSHCNEGEDASAFLLAREDVVRGSEIDSRFVHANRFYMTARPVTDHRVSDAIQSVFERADGIIANLPADGFVNIPELERLSQPGFFESLLDDEQAALPLAWTLLEISHAPIIDHQYRGSEIDRDFPFDAFIERPGRLQVPSFDVSELCWTTLCDRVQRLPGCNEDDDVTTIHYGDVLCALAEYRPVFTPAEVNQLEDRQQTFLDAATPADTGDYRIEFTEGVADREAATNLATFDGYSYDCSATSVLRYDGENPFGAEFHRNCRLSMPTTGAVSFRSLSGATTTPYYRDGVSLMEHWKGGERIYNRLVKVKYHDAWRIRKYRDYSEFLSARPMLDDGTELELTSASTPSGSSKLSVRRGVATLAAVPFAEVLGAVKVGRYESFQGVVIDVHGNRQLVAYFDGCELPLYKTTGSRLSTSGCSGSARSVSVEFSGQEVTLNVWVDGDILYRTRLDTRTWDRLDLDRTFIEF